MYDIERNEHDYAIHRTDKITKQQLREHNYFLPVPVQHITINQEYADDISRITSDPHNIKQLKATLPQQLAKKNLEINKTKTEEYKISRVNCDNGWKKCKFLGSLLDTDNDIKRRKSLSIDSLINTKYIFNNKKLNITT